MPLISSIQNFPNWDLLVEVVLLLQKQHWSDGRAQWDCSSFLWKLDSTNSDLDWIHDEALRKWSCRTRRHLHQNLRLEASRKRAVLWTRYMLWLPRYWTVSLVLSLVSVLLASAVGVLVVALLGVGALLGIDALLGIRALLVIGVLLAGFAILGSRAIPRSQKQAPPSIQKGVA